METFDRLYQEVIRPGLCTHCGSCAGLASGRVAMRQTDAGPLPELLDPQSGQIDERILQVCPGKGLSYPELYQDVFQAQPQNWLAGPCRRAYTGYSAQPAIRRAGASGGVITQTLLYLLERGEIDGAVVLRHGWPEAWLSAPVIATTPEEITAASQSVYVPTPVNVILEQVAQFDGRLAYVGLPDQVASIRRMQQLGIPGVEKIRYILGPYVGTIIYLSAIQSYLRSNGVQSLEEISELRYRAGEWPGYLKIVTRQGRVLQAEKFYYNYLIPFYLTRSTLHAVDFTNELCDISVGDAWHPSFEASGGGHSVVLARSAQGERILQQMQQEGLLVLEDIPLEEALSMHGHMLDFKKRGAFIRIGWQRVLGRPAPYWGYWPARIPFTRYLVEAFISAVIWLCHRRPARWAVERLPIGLVGPLFDLLRRSWKRISKPAKRKGLGQMRFITRGERGGGHDG